MLKYKANYTESNLKYIEMYLVEIFYLINLRIYEKKLMFREKWRGKKRIRANINKKIM